MIGKYFRPQISSGFRSYLLNVFASAFKPSAFGIEAKVIGRVEAAPFKEVVLTGPHGTFIYS